MNHRDRKLQRKREALELRQGINAALPRRVRVGDVSHIRIVPVDVAPSVKKQ